VTKQEQTGISQELVIVQQPAFKLLAIAEKLTLVITRYFSIKTFVIQWQCQKNLLFPMELKFEIDLSLISAPLNILILPFVAVVFFIPLTPILT
jgi:hypothetical protein